MYILVIIHLCIKQSRHSYVLFCNTEAKMRAGSKSSSVPRVFFISARLAFEDGINLDVLKCYTLVWKLGFWNCIKEIARALNFPCASPTSHSTANFLPPLWKMIYYDQLRIMHCKRSCKTKYSAVSCLSWPLGWVSTCSRPLDLFWLVFHHH